MRRVPWHLAARFGRKGVLTIGGIALAVAFSLVSFSAAEALRTDVVGLARNHPGTAFIVERADGAGFDLMELVSLNATGVLVGEGATADGPVVVVSLVGSEAVILPSGVARGPRGPVEIRVGAVVLVVAGEAGTAWVPPGAYLVGDEVFPPEATAAYAIVRDASVARRLASEGYIVTDNPALRSFFSTSGVELARDLALVVVFSSILATLFSYELLRSEVRERYQELGIWRALGMRRRDVVAIFLARAAIMGAAALIVAALVVVTTLLLVHRFISGSIGLWSLDPMQTLAVMGAFFVAVLAGGFFPAVRAGASSVQATLEAAP